MFHNFEQGTNATVASVCRSRARLAFKRPGKGEPLIACLSRRLYGRTHPSVALNQFATYQGLSPREHGWQWYRPKTCKASRTENAKPFNRSSRPVVRRPTWRGDSHGLLMVIAQKSTQLLAASHRC
jgi:hypothetical protein